MSQRFQDLERFTAADVDAAILRNDPEELRLAPITVALLADDVKFATEICCRFAVHADPAVRANAIASLGHLARRFRSLDELRVKPLLESALRDSDEIIRSNAKSAADEVHQFLHWIIAGHIYG